MINYTEFFVSYRIYEYYSFDECKKYNLKFSFNDFKDVDGKKKYRVMNFDDSFIDSFKNKVAALKFLDASDKSNDKYDIFFWGIIHGKRRDYNYLNELFDFREGIKKNNEYWERKILPF